MGKLRALQLGITKGVQHVTALNPKTKLSNAVNKVTSKMICTSCKHSSNAHTRRMPEFAAMSGRQILEILVPTRKGPNFDECFVFYCDICQALACDGHYDTDSCNGKHEQ
ncbi:MAG TPA: hypothetical protein VEP90_07495 [Methylomirabilota bacterium]|nr:hypothetical protein [Methylomirabilota bacterium]